MSAQSLGSLPLVVIGRSGNWIFMRRLRIERQPHEAALGNLGLLSGIGTVYDFNAVFLRCRFLRHAKDHETDSISALVRTGLDLPSALLTPRR